jgi:peptidoglycan hydrolase-like protein with peptidoglycan-binding domain
VERLQRLLIERGFDPGIVDGIFGPITKKAVIEFQKAYSLLVDGIVGPQTWGALCSTLPVT